MVKKSFNIFKEFQTILFFTASLAITNTTTNIHIPMQVQKHVTCFNIFVIYKLNKVSHF